ncbi:MAG: hypothetical protein PSN34_03410 [Urechidicola sp.]|nr:hypothetical protein [Urechidicola sp.]
MRKSPYQSFSKYRERHHLKLNDVAFLLKMNQGNLSRFEAGKNSNPKALLGYHILFDLSIGNGLLKDVIHSSKDIIHRCFNLLELLKDKPKTIKNQLRIKGVDDIISRLTVSDEDYEND